MRFSFIILLVLLNLGFLLPASVAAEHKHERILILHSYSKADWNDNIMTGIESLLGNRENLKMYVEYMDTKEFNTPEYYKKIHDALLIKYKDLDFDLVITSDDNAWNFAIKNDEELFNEAPIVFCGVNRFKPELIKGKKITGVVEKGDFKPTLCLISQALPRWQKLYVISDGTKTGKINMANLEKVMNESFPGTMIINTKDMSLQELNSTLKKATPEVSAAFFNAFWKDGTGKDISLSELEQAFRSSNIPIFGRSEWMINRGMVGGKCVSGFNQGEAAAKLALKILESPDKKIPPVITDSPNQFIFDHKELQKHQLLKAKLPEDAIVINKPFTLRKMYEEQKEFFWIATSLFGLLLITVAVLIADKIKRSRTEKALKESERKFKGIFNHSFQLMAVLDPKGRLIEINDIALNFHSADKKKVIGKLFWEGPWCRTPSLKKQIQDAVNEASKGNFVRLEIEETVEGKLKYTDISIKPVFDEDGKVSLLISEGRDITVLKEAFKALQQSEKNLHITLESIGDAVIATDAEGKITKVNRVAKELTGWDEDDAVGKKLQDVFQILDSKTGKKAEDPVQKVLKEGHIVGLANDTVLISKDNTKRQIADSSAPIKNEAGEIVGVVLVFRDVTEEYMLQEKLRQSQKMEAIGQLAGGVAHDFNNLLTAITGNAQLMAMSSKKLGEENNSLIEDILKASKRASDLTSQLLAFSRKGPIQNISLGIHEILDEVIAVLSHTIDRRINVKKKYNADPDFVTGDPSQLQNAFLNLGVNARDAMPDGGEMTFETNNVKINKNDRRSATGNIIPGDYIEIRISDTGCGMEREMIRRIFEPFFSTKTPGRGTGLGLASVYGCIGSHNGDIKVNSEVGKGSTFSILLPVKNASNENTISKNKQKTIKGKGHIMVVDDEDFVRKLCALSLEKLGYSVTTCADGMEALEYYRKNPKKADLIILDLVMPKISGHDTFVLLKEINPKVKVLILSGFSKNQAANKMLKAGALGFIGKPFDITTLSQEIARCLKQ